MELHNFRIHLPTKLTPDQGTVEYVSSPFNSSSSSPSNIVFPDQEGKTNKTVSLLQNVADTNTPIERVSSIHEYSELHFKNFTGVIRLEHITPLKTSFEGTYYISVNVTMNTLEKGRLCPPFCNVHVPPLYITHAYRCNSYVVSISFLFL